MNKKPDIKIFVSTRIDMDSVKVPNSLYIPVRCGAAFDKRAEAGLPIGDDTGDNISVKRLSLSEYTVMYWAWKNAKADYYGLCHYRRFLSFSEEKLPEGPLRQVYLDSMADANLQKAGILDEERMRREIAAYDAVLSEDYDIYKDAGSSFNDVKEDWENRHTSFLTECEFDRLFCLIKEMAPSYYEDSVRYAQGRRFRGFNLFILKKELFFDLCSFMFPILFEFEKYLDREHKSAIQNRAASYAGEWLYSIWCDRLYRSRKYRVNERKIVTFMNVEKPKKIVPAFHDKNIPVVIPLTDSNRAKSAVTFQSILDHCSSDRQYDFVFLQRSSDADQWRNFVVKQEDEVIKQMADDKENISVRFYDPKDRIGEIEYHEFGTPSIEEFYYGLLAPWIFSEYEKVLYVTENMIFHEDIQKLFNQDISEYYMAGVRDPLFIAMANGYFRDFSKETKKLHMKDVFQYISADMVLVNCSLIRRKFIEKDVISRVRNSKLNNIASDGINMIYGENIKPLNYYWSKFNILNMDYFAMQEYVPEKIMDEMKTLQKARLNKNGGGDNLRGIFGFAAPVQTNVGKMYWHYAKETPFFEELLGIFAILQGNVYGMVNRSAGNYVMSKLAPLGSTRRKIAKKIFPYGTRRREVVLHLYSKFCGHRGIR